MPNYWVLVANPDIYEVESAIREIPVDPWTTKGKPVVAGDRVAIWRARGRRRKERGIIAFGEVLSDPALIPYESSYWIRKPTGDEPRVEIRYVVPPGLPLLEDGPHAAVLDIAAARARGGTVFALPPDEWNALIDAAGGWPSAENEEVALARHAIDAIAGVGPGTGQGFLSSPAVKKLVEHRAMLIASEYYAEQGWDVNDVSAKDPYDLLCTRTGEELRVEVKGTRSEGWQVFLTSGEVANARNRYPGVALVVVAKIEVDEAEKSATGGEIAVFDPWRIDDGELKPFAFAYDIPR